MKRTTYEALTKKKKMNDTLNLPFLHSTHNRVSRTMYWDYRPAPMRSEKETTIMTTDTLRTILTNDDYNKIIFLCCIAAFGIAVVGRHRRCAACNDFDSHTLAVPLSHTQTRETNAFVVPPQRSVIFFGCFSLHATDEEELVQSNRIVRFNCVNGAAITIKNDAKRNARIQFFWGGVHSDHVLRSLKRRSQASHSKQSLWLVRIEWSVSRLSGCGRTDRIVLAFFIYNSLLTFYRFILFYWILFASERLSKSTQFSSPEGTPQYAGRCRLPHRSSMKEF